MDRSPARTFLLSRGCSAIDRVVRAGPGQSDRLEVPMSIRVLRAIDVCYARIYHRLDVCSPCHLPREGPAILVSNHTSGLDPLLIQAICPRLIRWMVAREYFELPVLRRIFERIAAIPVERSGRDSASARAALRALKSGAVLGVFPEGRIERSIELLPFQPGVAMMAITMAVPVYPAYVDGTQRTCNSDMLKPFLYRQTARIAFGNPLHFGDRTARPTVHQAITAIRGAVQNLQNSGIPE